jgi:hypothetical protein
MSAVSITIVGLLTSGGSSIEEKLTDPQTVERWSETDLVLASGRKLRLPGVPRLPASLPLLSQMVERGVEVGSDGRIIGLVKIWHWCGNDPVREHIARVDIANVLLYFGHGPVPAACEEYRPRERQHALSRHGWSVSDFLHFESFQTVLSVNCFAPSDSTRHSPAMPPN